ncbi:MAG: hypothetical protein JXA11_04220 [Phycisphaerae bacterium]|nr:hypothetical protein [Phycisphaerae bacterium]
MAQVRNTTLRSGASLRSTNPQSLPLRGRVGWGPIRTAFSLVEILVIIAILVLLVGIIVPSFNNFRDEMKANLTRNNIAMIATACDMYANDFDETYPPSNDPGNIGLVNGKEIIVLLLTGYAGDGNNSTSGEPYTKGSNTLAEDDGKDGFGFRTVKRGIVYGPYNGTEQIPTVEGSDPPVFADAFGNPILYYLAGTANNFDPSHNNDGAGNGADPTNDNLDQYESIDRPFLIISPGKDEAWNEDDDDNDDLVNQ